MGKSGTTSCFKFVGCGDPDSVDRDDLPAEETMDSNDKRKWSFRKRSPAHRVLSNSVISETSFDNKSRLDTATVGFQKQVTSTNTDSKFAEKISPAVEKSAPDVILDEFSSMEKNAGDVTPDEKNAAVGPPDEFCAVGKSAVEVNLEESSAVEKSATAVTPDESSVIIIQTAVRGFLAQKDGMKNNAMIMLQAAIRGYIVRKAAVGSLRCVQAIVKMQLLIRKRRACTLQEGSRFEEKDGKLDKEDSKGMEKLGSKVVTYTPIEELLRNSFARQLLESDLRSKAINIKCEPLKSDSAWKWMERWMSIYSNGSSNNSPGLEYTRENPDEKSLDKSNCIFNSGISLKTKSSDGESVVLLSEGDEKNGIRHGMPNFESNNDIGRPCPVMTTCSEDRNDDVSDSFANESEMQCKQQIESKFDDVSDSLLGEATKSSFASNKDPLEREYKEHIESSCGASIMEPVSLTNESNSSETTGKKVVLLGCRRSSNSAFIAAQSKFEELSLSGNSSAKPVGLLKTLPPLKASSLPPASEVDIVIGSESGTELSVSSTLDSPHGDVIDDGAFDDAVNNNNNTSVLEDKHDDDDYQKKNHMMNSTVDTEVDSPIMEGISFQDDKHKNLASDGSNDDGSVRAVEQTESDGSRGLKVHMETELSHPLSPKNVQTESSHPLMISPFTPQASPRSHVTGPDFQDTPSSHVSVKSKESSRKSDPDRKQKSGSCSGNAYKSDSNHDLEQLSMDKKTGKRRNSFGSASTDHGNQDQRESSSSSNSIPSYMQATESARAKAIANNSPRSIPDTLGKDFHVKKRHSLPGVNKKHVSPQSQAQQSMFQTLQDAKANGVHSPQERKWRR